MFLGHSRRTRLFKQEVVQAVLTWGLPLGKVWMFSAVTAVLVEYFRRRDHDSPSWTWGSGDPIPVVEREAAYSIGEETTNDVKTVV
ncbi:MAG: hypothetical protein CL912_01860 [Deltaproteobacteria bacterium]|nr:hypothetical protein [Deltaproteobacteria bacterium]